MATSAPAAPTPSRRGRLGLVAIGLLAAVCAGGWAIIMANAGRQPGIAKQTITYSVLSDSAVQIKYSISKGKSDEVRCVVDAFDTDFAIVGKREIIVPSGTKTITRTDLLATSKRATGARVESCHKV
ncbi:DUF4307 domain-containing protein [Actinomadura rudentiformis]|uniref:DUF4307 domain-containing protein n=1 Tax=Actinomadura rudentiformis TaxID=359158 RepID=A0A6H9YVE3_9ACTN|nr:DUF4307 domain-containing protein [Actinomadura rudentiformis]KAB2343983.1 DUF4307 domain-containing protein [Actinomadura rudentiformis]